MNWLLRTFHKFSSGNLISSQDIYSIFAISFLLNQKVDHETSKLATFEAQIIKNKFVQIFLGLMRNQIKKYLGRSDRYDPNQMSFLRTFPNADAATLAKMFDSATFRSERHRAEYPDEIYNSNWGEIARCVDKLSKANSLKDVVMGLAGQAGLFNLIHNTGTVVLDKLPGAAGLLAALDDCHANQPSVIVSKSNSDVRTILSPWMRLQ